MNIKKSTVMLTVIAVLTMALSLSLCKAGGPETGNNVPKEHSQVVGCGSKSIHDWKPGCCEGTGGCVNMCNNEVQYCD